MMPKILLQSPVLPSLVRVMALWNSFAAFTSSPAGRAWIPSGSVITYLNSFSFLSPLLIFYITVTIQHPHSQNRSFRASLLLMWLLFSSIHPTAVRTLPYLPPVPPDTSLRYLLQGIRKFRREVPSVYSGMPWTGRLPVPNR